MSAAKRWVDPLSPEQRAASNALLAAQPLPRENHGGGREWDNFAATALVPTHHATTSSRHPGTVFRGTTWSARRSVVACVACGGLRLELGGVHAPHWRRDGVLVDCAGREVRDV